MLSVAYRLHKEVTATLCQLAAQKDTQVAKLNIYEHIFYLFYEEIHVVHFLKVLKENKNDSLYINTVLYITTGNKQTLQSN